MGYRRHLILKVGCLSVPSRFRSSIHPLHTEHGWPTSNCIHWNVPISQRWQSTERKVWWSSTLWVGYFSHSPSIRCMSTNSVSEEPLSMPGLVCTCNPKLRLFQTHSKCNTYQCLSTLQYYIFEVKLSGTVKTKFSVKWISTITM
jgi:hypothetical protein